MLKIADVISTRLFIGGYLLFSTSIAAHSQAVNKADTALTLGQCIDYALKHQPFVNQALINEAITRTTNSIAIASW